MKVKLVPYQEQDAPVVYEHKTYQFCFEYDGSLVLKDDVNGVKCFSGKPEDDIIHIKQLTLNGHIQFGDSQWLQEIYNKVKSDKNHG